MANNISQIETGVDTSDATATAAQILTGQTAYVNGNKVTGSMANQGAVSQALNAGGSYTIPAGYHNGSGKVTANSLASQTSATATAAQILSGKTAYVNGAKVTGTMTNRGAVKASLTDGGSYTIPAGYHNGSGKVTATSSGAKLNLYTQTSEPSKKDGIWVKTSNQYKKAIVDNRILSSGGVWTKPVSDLPYALNNGSAVVYNGEIHILGNATSHYKWNGSSWTSVSTLPYQFQYGSAVVYNGEIHILGSGNSSNATRHYKWNGSSWTSVSTLPYQLNNGSAVVYNGTSIYILGSGASSATMKYRATFTSPANTYDPYTLIIQRGGTNNGVYITAFADMSVITGSNNRFQTGFDDAWYFGASAFETTPIYYGDGAKWIKFKN